MEFTERVNELIALVKGMSGQVAQIVKDQEEQKALSLDYGDRIRSMEEKLKSHPTWVSGVEEEKKKGKKFNLLKLALAISERNPKFAPFEWETAREAFAQKMAATPAQARDLATDPDSAAGFAVPAQYIPEFIELLYAKSVVRELGAMVLGNLTGSPVLIPRVTGGATGYWVGETASITKSNATVGQLKLEPRRSAARTIMSNRLIRLADPSVEQLVMNDFVRQIRLTQDKAFLRGGVSANEPLGVLNTPDISTLDMLSATSTIDDLLELVNKVEEENADDGALGIATSSAMFHWFRKLKDGEGKYYLIPDPELGFRGGQILGYPIRKTTQIPKNLGAGANESEVYFGNWSDALIAEWGNLEIRASSETSDAFEKDQTHIRIIHEVDFGVRHAKSFALMQNVKIS